MIASAEGVVYEMVVGTTPFTEPRAPLVELLAPVQQTIKNLEALSLLGLSLGVQQSLSTIIPGMIPLSLIISTRLSFVLALELCIVFHESFLQGHDSRDGVLDWTRNCEKHVPAVRGGQP